MSVFQMKKKAGKIWKIRWKISWNEISWLKLISSVEHDTNDGFINFYLLYNSCYFFLHFRCAHSEKQKSLFIYYACSNMKQHVVLKDFPSFALYSVFSIRYLLCILGVVGVFFFSFHKASFSFNSSERWIHQRW